MSFKGLLDRTVTLVPRTPAATKDAYGNEVLEDGAGVEVKSRRDLVTGQESTDDEQRGTRDWLYFFEADVAIDRLTKIVDGADELEVLVVDEATGRKGVHHLEVTARLVEGG